MMNKKHVGMTLGIFAAALHLIWLIIVALGWGQSYLNLIFPLHAISNTFTVVAPLSVTNSIILLVLAFAGGYIFGWLFAWLYNKVAKR